MNFNIIENQSGKYIELVSAKAPIHSEQDALDIIAIGFENDINLLVIHSETLSDDFFKLRTGVAGKILQKFINYRMKLAIIMENEQLVKGKFKELLAESNKGNDFRVFNNIDEVENWYSNLILIAR